MQLAASEANLSALIESHAMLRDANRSGGDLEVLPF